MSAIAPFRLKLTGDTADRHQFQGYDGYMALAGFAWTLSLITNYTETGKIRHRGEFPGRHAVRAKAPNEGSVVADFLVQLQSDPTKIFGSAVEALSSTVLLYALVKRVVDRNIGEESEDKRIKELLSRKSGDIEALVAISEAAIRQTHNVIGNGADKIEICGGINILNTFTEKTKDYVRQNVEDDTVITKTLTVSAFNANSGYGSVFDNDLGHVVPFSMNKDRLNRYRSIFSWGLDQYSNRTGGRIRAKFTRILTMDDRPKRYIIINAERIIE